MKITLKQMRVFEEIARAGSVSRAAKTLNVTQSAASMALKDLEDHLDAQVFHRHGKRVILNDYGRWLRREAHEVLLRVKAIEDSRRTGGLRGHVNIVASSTIANYLLPAAVTRFVEQHSDVVIDLSISNTEHIIKGLESLAIDIGFIEGNCDSNELALTPWREDELIVLAAPNHPIANRTGVRLEDLSTYCWVLREPGSGTREVFAQALQGRTKPLRVQLELGNSEAIKQAVKIGSALGCLSRLVVSGELERRELIEVPVENLSMNRILYLVTRQDSFRSPVLEEFITKSSFTSPRQSM